MSKWVYLNNSFVEENNALLPFTDLGFQRGYAVFDFFRLIENSPLHLDDHLDRFVHSAREMRLPIPTSKEKIKTVIAELIGRNNLPWSGIRIQLTGGPATENPELLSPILIISQHAFPTPTETQLGKGIHLVTFSHQRQLPHVKTTDYLMSLWLQPYVKDKGADDLLYHTGGLITESPRSNFFIVTGEEALATPAEDILKGITRKKVLGIASKKLKVEERAISLEEAFYAREAFITSTTKQILPVTKLNGRPIGNGIPGPITRELQEGLSAFCGFVAKSSQSFAEGSAIK